MPRFRRRQPRRAPPIRAKAAQALVPARLLVRVVDWTLALRSGGARIHEGVAGAGRGERLFLAGDERRRSGTRLARVEREPDDALVGVGAGCDDLAGAGDVA